MDRRLTARPALRLLLPCLLLIGCSPRTDTDWRARWPAVAEWTTLDLSRLHNYADPVLPAHFRDPAVVATDQARLHPITDAGATLGRVLFFDRRLSTNDSVACATCHIPAFGFTDSAAFSRGVAGTPLPVRTMRLSNLRWYAGQGFLWDRRAPTVEEQVTQPITDAREMGWDARRGGLDALVAKLDTLVYYRELFAFAWGDSTVTADGLRRALAMYVRSLVSAGSRWDREYAREYDPALPDRGLLRDLPGFTPEENRGRQLFMASVADGGLGCAGCHVPPSFALAADARGNGITPGETVVFKAPSLRNAALSGPYMHNGRFERLGLVVAFYADFVNPGPAVDARLLEPDGSQRRHQLLPSDAEAVASFLATLTDSALGRDPRHRYPLRK